MIIIKQRNRKVKLQLAALALSTTLLTGNASAQDQFNDKEEFNFDPLVVTAMRAETTDLNTPSSIQVYTQEQLINTGAINLFDALRFTIGLSSYAYGPGGQAYGGMKGKIVIRGTERGTLVMIDGMPINLNDSYSLDTLPIENIERVEVLKGAASVLYGNDASAGVINIITKKKATNSVSVMMGENGRTSKNLSFATEQFSFSGTLENNDVLKGLSSNGNAFGNADKSSILWKYKINDRLTMMHQHTENEYDYLKFNTSNWNTPLSKTTYDYKEDFLRLRYDGTQWDINVYANQSDRDVVGQSNVTFKELGLDLQTDWKTDFANFIGGISTSTENYKNVVFSDNKRINADRDSYALFLQSTKELGNDVTAIVGVRQQWVKATATKSIDAFCPQFQVLKKLDDNNSLYINTGKSFKMPSFTSMYGNNSPNFGANPNLKPEEGWSYEAGWKKAMNDSMLKFAVFYMDMDAISYKANSDGVNIATNNPFKNTGIEINFDKQLSDRFAYNVGASLSNPKTQDTKGIWGRQQARQQYTAGIKYNYDRWQASLMGSLTADRVGWKDMLPVNLNVRYAATKDSVINVAVENILDRQDIIGNWTSATSTQYYSAPRNVRVTYTQNF